MFSLSFPLRPFLSLRSLWAHPARMLVPAVVLSLTAASAFAAGESDARTTAARATCETPTFPLRWQDAGDSGTVTLAVLVGEDGAVKDARLLGSSGIARVDRASLKASTRCKFQPMSKDTTLPAWTKVQYTWIVD